MPHTENQWELPAPANTAVMESQVPTAIAKILAARGLDSAEKLRLFLEPPHRLPYNPLQLPGMDSALQRLYRAVERREAVGIFGDFDVDGVTGTAIVAEGLSALGVPVEPYLPHRVEEGHGLSDEAVSYLTQRGASLIITVDCGVSSVSEVERARQLSSDVIITDHHTPPEVAPAAIAIINPRMPGNSYPFTDLCGAGLAFKLVQGIYEFYGQPWNRSLLELAALGTIADLVPLLDENRFLVNEGLREMARTARPGLRALYRRASIATRGMNGETVSYQVSPRLNAPGRMGHSMTSYRLLTTDSPAEAESLADEIESLNQERRSLTELAVAIGIAQVEGKGTLPPILMVHDTAITPGIAGLVAGRLAETYHRPSVVMASVDSDRVIASGRSVPEFNLIESFAACEDLFLRYGGHSQAAGFTLLRSRIPELGERLSALAAPKMVGRPPRPVINIDAEVSLEELTPEALQWLEDLEPFGVGNPLPVFLSRGLRIVDSQYIGRQSQHLKLRARQGKVEWTVLAFNQADKWSRNTSVIDLVHTIMADTWNGERRLNLRALDFRPATA